jgi:CheY-like chemotaxis protein
MDEPIILYVDPDEDSRYIHQQLFRVFGYRGICAPSVGEALHLARTVRPSLVVTELFTSPPQGFEVLRLLRAEPATRSVPVVVLSAYALPDDGAAAVCAGAHARSGPRAAPEPRRPRLTSGSCPCQPPRAPGPDTDGPRLHAPQRHRGAGDRGHRTHRVAAGGCTRSSIHPPPSLASGFSGTRLARPLPQSPISSPVPDSMPRRHTDHQHHPARSLDVRDYLSARELAAADEVVARVRGLVPGDLAFAALFGSRARRQARADSDVDILLVFRRLTWDREPQAGMAEEIADAVTEARGIPVATWTVSLPDLERGRRTPMLVDALDDGIALWPWGCDVPRIAFTPWDACFCAASLLQRVREGSDEVAAHLAAGDAPSAVRRARDDVARLCTAALLLRGETRPRRASAVRRFGREMMRDMGLPRIAPSILDWAASSYGATGKDDEIPVPPPPGQMRAVSNEVDVLWRWVAMRRARLEEALRRGAGRSMPGGGGHRTC